MRYVLIVLLSLPAWVMGQSSFSLSNDSILIGDQLQLEHRVLTPKGSNIEPLIHFWDSVEQSVVTPFEVVKSPQFDTLPSDSGNWLRKQWFITSFDTLGGDLLDTAKGFPLIPIAVVPFPVDSTNALVDIFEIYDVPYTWDEYLKKYGWIGLLLLVGFLALYLVLKIKRGKRAMEDHVEVLPDPYEVVLGKLSALNAQGVSSKDELKGFYTEVSYALREYLDGIHAAPILEMDLSEIKKWTIQESLNAEAQLITLLERGDLIKFAKADAPGELAQEDLKIALDLVKTWNQEIVARKEAEDGQE